jgi:uroporphyrin-III C-methyltransferase
MINKIFPSLTLVGAGAGDPDLITLKAVKAINSADIILYDALVEASLLDYAKTDTPKIFVGKRAGKHALTQDEINQLIVKSAFSYGKVVRLKGGDPMVFGRAGEEILYAEAFNIPVEIVPGVSSVTASAAAMNFPLTMRGLSKSYSVITATNCDNSFNEELKNIEINNNTLVILMGLGKIKQIIAHFKAKNQHDLPIAIIQNATTQTQKFVTGKIDNIMQMVTENKIAAPAVIIIGEVVNFREKVYGQTNEEKSQIHLLQSLTI